MNWIPVDSSSLNAVAYDSSSSTLFVKFNSGGTYEYYNVPENVYQSLMSASSLGSFLASRIKGTYEYRQI